MKSPHHSVFPLGTAVVLTTVVVCLGWTSYAHAESLFDVQPRLRACCALGKGLRTQVGPLAVPVRLHNVIGVESLTTHAYRGRSVFHEKNGLLYTCRGGLIDTGHVRTAADWTAYLYSVAQKYLGEGGTHEVALDGSRVVLEFHPADISENQRGELARAVAASAAYDVARWHELSTWYGGTSVDIYSELFSALSPEDLYSDLLGVKIASRVLEGGHDYDTALASLLRESVQSLGAVDPAVTQRVLDQLEDYWWDPRVPLPRKALLRKRNVDTTPPLTPWRVPSGWTNCSAADETAILDVVGPDIRSYVTLTFHPEPGTPLGESVSARDLGRRIAEVGEEVRTEFGSHSTSWEVPPPRPEPEATPELALPQSAWPEAQGIRLLPLEIVGGLAGRGAVADYRASLGARLVGGLAQTSGGDLSIARITGFAGHTDRGFVTHLVGVRSRSVYFCKNRDGETWHAPIFSWFHDCDGRGWLGIGGTLMQWQSDSKTDRRVLRPIELNLVVNLFANALSPGFLRHSLEVFGGASVDSRSTSSIPGIGGTELSWRSQGGMRLRLRSPNLRWELEGFGSIRRDVAERRDRALEVGGRATHRILIRESLDEVTQGPLVGIVTLAVEGGFSYWDVPANAVADWLFPVVSASAKRTTQVLLSVGFTYEGFTI